MNNMRIAALRMTQLLCDLTTAAQGNVEKLEPCDLRAIVVSASKAALACNEHANVQLTVAVPQETVVFITRDIAETYAPVKISVAYGGQKPVPKPFIMVLLWIKRKTDGK